jgi:succinate dehydrogenase/fumarate reductase flavoprotein subunit
MAGEIYDVIVVGAGNAGLTAALAAAGWREPMRPTLQRRTAHRIVAAAEEMKHDNRHH